MEFTTISGNVRYATSKNNRDDRHNKSNSDNTKEKNTFDTILDTAHMVADVLSGFDD